MLKSISNAQLHSPFVLFVGRSDDQLRGGPFEPAGGGSGPRGCGGAALFLSVLESLVRASERVTHVLCWDRRTWLHLQALAREEPSKLHLHNCFADSQGWVNPECRESGLLSTVERSLLEDGREINVVVDSLSNPLFTIGLGPCIAEIQQVINSSTERGPKIHQLLCLVNEDILPCGRSSLFHLKHIAGTIVELGKKETASITHRKPGGHVERKEERYTILPQGQISIEPFRTSGRTRLIQTEDKPSTLPQDVASFRVGLSEKEKEARNKLVLPYMRTSDKPEDGAEAGGGKVFYQPDAVDDWDDEDPDDDLDI